MAHAFNGGAKNKVFKGFVAMCSHHQQITFVFFYELRYGLLGIAKTQFNLCNNTI